MNLPELESDAARLARLRGLSSDELRAALDRQAIVEREWLRHFGHAGNMRARDSLLEVCGERAHRDIARLRPVSWNEAAMYRANVMRALDRRDVEALRAVTLEIARALRAAGIA